MKSRKLWFAIILMVVYISCAILGRGEDIMEVSPALLTIFGTYVVGNVGSKFKE